MHWDYGMGHGFGFGMGWLWLIVLVAVVILMFRLMGKQENVTTKNNAIDILKERYAKGEIDKEEFEQKRKDLTNS